MFVDPTLAVTDALLWIRELGTIGLIILVGWNARAGFQFVKDFYKSAQHFMSTVQVHMSTMEAFAKRVESNHMKHMEQYLYKIAKDRNITSLVAPVAVEEDDLEPPTEDGHDASSL